MSAHGAHLRCLFAYHHMTAVAAHPDGVSLTTEDKGVLDVLQHLAVALLVALLDGTYATELLGDLVESLFLGFLGHAVVHVGPLVVLAFCGSLQVLSC